jgi:hypothetical protein
MNKMFGRENLDKNMQFHRVYKGMVSIDDIYTIIDKNYFAVSYLYLDDNIEIKICGYGNTEEESKIDLYRNSERLNEYLK